VAEQISLNNARMLALAGQGLLESTAPKTVLETIDTLGVLQIDSVNVFERAHYMPLFSRLGAYDKAELDKLHGGKNPALIEYWAHEASFVRTENYPQFGYRMEKNQRGTRTSYERWADENREFLDWIKGEIRARGPLSTSDFEHERAVRKGSWWGWSDVKRALEYMFMYGELVSGGRESFSRLYALPEQVLPKRIREKAVDPIAARKQLLIKAATAHGVGTAVDLADYFRMNAPFAKTLLNELVEDKKLHYRIEIYTPEPKRIFGYYTLPILHNGEIVGRVDLKNDRQSKTLLVQSAWHEEDFAAKRLPTLARNLAAHLAEAAAWQGCERIEVKQKGNLSAALAKAVKTSKA